MLERASISARRSRHSDYKRRFLRVGGSGLLLLLLDCHGPLRLGIPDTGSAQVVEPVIELRVSPVL